MVSQLKYESNKTELEKNHFIAKGISDSVCPECGNTLDIIRDNKRGEIICGNCGIVISDHLIDQGPEWRAYTTTDVKKRVRTEKAAHPIIQNKGLSTVIDWHDQDIYGKKIAPKKRAKMYRLRRWQNRSLMYSNSVRNLTKAMYELERLASQIELSRNIKQKAAFIYRKARKGGYLKGKDIKTMIAASIYAAWRLQKIPRVTEEIVDYTKVNKKIIARNYRYLVECLNLNIPLLTPSDYIVRFCEELQLSTQIQHRACRIIQLAQSRNLTSGKDPRGLAAAVIYIAGDLEGEHCTQREISEVSHVSEVTIRNRYKEIVRKLNLKFSSK